MTVKGYHLSIKGDSKSRIYRICGSEKRSKDYESTYAWIKRESPE
jgi:hypothetical protein